MFIFFGLILVIALFFFVGNKIRANNQKKRDADGLYSMDLYVIFTIRFCSFCCICIFIIGNAGLLMADYEDRTYQRLEI